MKYDVGMNQSRGKTKGINRENRNRGVSLSFNAKRNKSKSTHRSRSTNYKKWDGELKAVSGVLKKRLPLWNRGSLWIL